jgi:CBS domain-containing protein
MEGEGKMPKVKDVMTKEPACCTPDTDLVTVGKMMCERDCGELPVVASRNDMKPIGVITDRDVVCRSIAKGKNPLELKAKDCMTAPVATVSEEADMKEVISLMERRQIRRVVIVDKSGHCIGIVSQADIARQHKPRATSEVVEKVSEPSHN